MDQEEELFQMHLLREESPNPHKLLLDNLRSKHYAAFKSLASRGINRNPPSVDINYFFPHPVEKTFLDIACGEGLDHFVHLLLQLGADPNRINTSHNRAPLHFAAEAGHHSVLRVLLQDPTINPNLESGRQTALHIAARRNDLECAEVLLENSASPNVPNSKGLTPTHVAAMNGFEDMVRLIFSKARCPPDIDSFKDFMKKTTRQVLEQKLPNLTLPAVSERETDIGILRYHLECNDEVNFLKSLENLEGIMTDNGELIKIAAKRNFSEAVRQLIGSKEGETAIPGLNDAAEAAVIGGHHEVLRELIYAKAEPGGKLLIKACQELGMSSRSGSDRMQCLKLLLLQPNVNVRCQDDKGNTPLHYAARAESSEAVGLLLRAGSYIGQSNILGVPPLAHISPESLSQYLDDCLQSSKERTEDYEIEFSYRCLMPHKLERDDVRNPLLERGSFVVNKAAIEMEPVQYIANNASLRHLLKHPILSSFLYLKWHRIRHILYTNFIFYVIFYILLNMYILCMTYDSDKPTASEVTNAIDKNITNNMSVVAGETTNTNDKNVMDTETVVAGWQQGGLLWALTAIALVVLALRETLQLLSSPCHYFLSLENWLELTLVCLGMALLAGAGPQVGAVAILLSAWELVILIGQHPRMSTGIEMFKTVTVNFMRFLFLYAFLILAFALAFFTLFKKLNEETFLDPGHSLFKTIIMLTGEFDANDIPFASYPVLSRCVFILFVFLIAIVLFNLLNGLAVSDTADILGQAELVGLISRAQLITYVEGVLVGTPVFNNPRCCCHQVLNRSVRVNPLMFLARKILFFPNFLPKGRLSVKPYKCNCIVLHGREKSKRNCSALTMDKDIMARAREILSLRGHVSESEKITMTLAELSRRFEKLETAMDNMRHAIENNNFNASEAE